MAADDTNFNITANVTQALEAIESVNKKLTQFGNNIATEFNKIPQAAQLASAAFLALGASVASFADKIVNTANATEDSIGSVLAFTQALGQNGGKIDQTARIMERFAVTIEGINKGNTGAYHAIQSLGISFEELGTMSQQALRDKVLKSLSEIEDPLRRNALAAQFFGRTFANVDIKKFYEDEMKSRQEMERFAPAVQSANDAFDNMKRILMSIQLAFAQAFKPIFDIIKQINPDIDTMTATFKAIGLALVFMGSAAVIRGLLVLRDTLVAITIAARANPFIAIASALIAAGYAVAEYTDLLKSSDDQAKENGKTQEKIAEKTTRDQTGLIDVLQRQKNELMNIGKELDKNFKNAQAKYQLELDNLSRNKEEITIADELNKIQIEGNNALFQLKQKYNSMDTATRNANLGLYKQEEAQIKSNIKAEQDKAQNSLSYLAQQKTFYTTLQAIQTNYSNAEQQMFNARAKQAIDLSSYTNQITVESKLVEIQQVRAELTKNLSEISDRERNKAIKVISEATDNVNLLKEGYEGIGRAIAQSIQDQVTLGQISQETADKLNKNLEKNYSSIAQSAKALSATNLEITKQSREFSQGWEQAFKKYSEDARNGATAAATIFNTATKGMEDTIVEFAKTGKLSFDTMLQNIAEDILRSQIRQLIGGLFASPTIPGAGQPAAAGAGLLSGFGKLLGFADGGTIGTNAPVVVGERGPEIISGAAGKTVTPNSGMGANVTYNINAVDARSFQQMVAADPSFIYAVTLRGQNMVPGGGFR